MSRRAFRWMGKSMTSVIPALSLTLLIGLALWPSKASAENNAPPLEEVVRVEGEARRQALAVLAELELARTKEKTKWRWRKTPSENKARVEEGKTERIARQGGSDPGGARVGEGKAETGRITRQGGSGPGQGEGDPGGMHVEEGEAETGRITRQGGSDPGQDGSNLGGMRAEEGKAGTGRITRQGGSNPGGMRVKEEKTATPGKLGASSKQGEHMLGGLAEVVRFALYGLMILALAACVVFFYRNWARFWPKTLPQKSERSTTLFGLDLRPETLPDDIPAAALAAAEAGRWIHALSLLYCGALVTLIERDRVTFRAGDTENLCLARVSGHIEGDTLTAFAALLADWKAAAYAGRLPTLARMRALCADWRAHFAAPALVGEVGA